MAKVQPNIKYRISNVHTYLCGHNKPIIGSRSALSFPPGDSALRTPHPVGHTNRSHGFFKLVFPTGTRSYHPPMATASNTRLGEASSSIRTTWPSQRNGCLLIRLTTPMSLKSSYSSRLVRIR